MSLTRHIEEQFELFDGLDTSIIAKSFRMNTPSENEEVMICGQHDFFSFSAARCPLCAREKRLHGYYDLMRRA